MHKIQSVCVYCGSSPGTDPVFVEAGLAFGRILAHNKIRLVYGGGGLGIMGAIAHAVMEAGGAVTGIIPEFLVEREHAELGVHGFVVTRDLHERKRLMFEQSDAFVALPGGIGTLEELVEQLTWVQLQQHKKPVAIANIAGFWNPLLALFDHQRQNGFIRADLPMNYLVADSVEQILPKLQEAVRHVPETELRGAAALAVAQKV